MKKAITKSLMLLSTISLTAGNPPTPELEENIKGTFMVESSDFNFPSFPKATFYNKKDTITFQGNHMGQINYSLPTGKYNILIEPGIDPYQHIGGEEFIPYEKNLTISKNNSLERLSR